MRKIKRQDICWRSGNSEKRKATPRQPNPRTPLSKNKASYKALILTKSIAVVIPLTITQSPSWTLPNKVSYLKGSLMESFTLGPTPKIDFTRIVEHTPATARELADLRFSLNTLSKHYGIRYRIHTIYKPIEPSIHRLIENLNLLKFELWLSRVRTEVSLVPTVICNHLPE